MTPEEFHSEFDLLPTRGIEEQASTFYLSPIRSGDYWRTDRRRRSTS